MSSFLYLKFHFIIAPEATKKPVVITKPKPATTRKPKPKTNAPKLRLEIPVNEDMCGKRIAKGRVVGGYADSRDNWPWIALLVKASSTEKVWCGASILNAKFALTAAHCLSSYRATEAKDWKLRVGMSDLTKKHGMHFYKYHPYNNSEGTIFSQSFDHK